ncbi:hypothetical protein ACJJTC_016934 [Scirpophaga incertulas]
MPDQEVESNRDLVTIKNWLCKQPHLPHDVVKLWTQPRAGEAYHRLFFTIRLKCTRDILKATSLGLWANVIKEKKAQTFFLRSSLYSSRCMYDQNNVDKKRLIYYCFYSDLIPLPRKTKENYKVFIYRLNNPDLDLFNFVEAVRAFFMLADTRLTEEEDIPAGEIPIFDSANVSLKFIGKVNLSVLRKYMLYTQEAIPIRLKQVHVINAPAYIGKLHAICKPFLKTEVAKLIKFHEPNSTTLYKDIPQEILPVEYGGKAGTIEEIKRYWIKRIEAKRDWFLTHDQRWAVDESLRPANCHDERTDKVRDLPGSFRSLALD